MRPRIRCPFHKEDTPSLVKRVSDWYCYGACQKSYSNKEVEDKTGEHYEDVKETEKVIDLTQSFEYIETLPFQSIRGLSFRANERGYYVCWPNRQYYKFRLFSPSRGSKYIGPCGLHPPLFWARRLHNATLCVCEGEVNAMSLAEAVPDWDICSPGSASMFNSTNFQKYLNIFKEYNNVTVVLDNDAAGIKGLIEAKAFFLYKIPFITFLQMSPDPNEVLIEYGKEALRKAVQGKNLE